MPIGDQIFVDYAAMEEASSQIQQSSRTIEERMSSLKSQLQRITWEGTDAGAYQANQAKMDAAIADMNQLLNTLSNAVASARSAYGDVERSGTQAWE